MKKILLILTFCLINLGFSQTKPYVAPQLAPLVVKYINDAKDRGIDVVPDIANNVNYIVIDFDLHYPTLGYYNPSRKGIHIASFTLIDVLILRGTVYHELTHAVLNNSLHACNKCSSIMSQISPDTFAGYNDDVTWNKELDILFTWIKKIKEE